MIRPLEVFIGLRYTRAKRRNHFISFISSISILGIFLAVTVLITVLSVMNGFGTELRSRILGVVSHITVSKAGGRLDDWRELGREIARHPEVRGVAPYILGQGMVAHGKTVKGVMVRGVLPEKEPRVSRLGENMKAGALADLKPGEFGIIVGSALAWRLDVGVGSRVTLVIPQALVSPAGILPRFKRFKVVGIFDVGHHLYDSGLVLVHIRDAALLYHMGDTVSGLRLKLDDLYQAPRVAAEIESEFRAGYYARDWTYENPNFFKALKTEKRVMTIILLMIVAVAAFNIVSTLIMVVTDKQADIAILRTLGLSPASIMGVFMVQGTVIGTFGTLIGAAGGITLAYYVEDVVRFIERLFGVSFLSPDVYYITDLPSDIYVSDVLTITVASFAISILATLYPAWRASRVQPAKALRYE